MGIALRYPVARARAAQWLKRLSPLRLKALPWRWLLMRLVIMSLAGVLCFFVGLLPIFGGIVISLLFAGGVASLGLLALPPGYIVRILFAVVLVVAGMLSYLGGISQASWIPYLMLLLLLVKLPMEALGQRPDPRDQRHITWVMAVLVGYFVIFAGSAWLNKPGANSILVASKNYLLVWTLFALVAFNFVEDASLFWLQRFFLWIAILQLPFAIVERFYIARIGNHLNWDAVVGTFGGNYLSGGASGVMAYFLVYCALSASATYAADRLSARMHWAVLFCAFASIALAEVKVVFILLPLGYAWLFRQALLRNPLRAIGWATVLGAALASIFLIYQLSMWDETVGSDMSLEKSGEYVMSTESNLDYYNPITREVSRIGALVRWERFNPPSDLQHFLLGHGPGASRESQTVGAGVAARRYPFSLTTSTASVLLWEVGLLGFGAFLVLLLSGGWQAERLAKRTELPIEHQLTLRVTAVALFLAAALTIYNRDAIDTAPMQCLLALFLGQVVLLSRRREAPEGAIAPARLTLKSVRAERFASPGLKAT